MNLLFTFNLIVLFCLEKRFKVFVYYAHFANYFTFMIFTSYLISKKILDLIESKNENNINDSLKLI